MSALCKLGGPTLLLIAIMYFAIIVFVLGGILSKILDWMIRR